MVKLKLLKAWSHAGNDWEPDDVLDVEDGEALAKDLIDKGIAELDAGQVTKAKAPGPTEDEKPLTREDIAKMVADAGRAKSEEDDTKIKRPHIAVGKDRAVDDPKRGYKKRRDFFHDVYVAGSKSGPPPELLRPLSVKAVGSDEHSVAADQYGGFTIPEGFLPEFLKVTPEGDILAGRTKPIPMQTPTVHISARVDKNHSTSVSGGLTFSRREEMGTKDPTRIEFERVTLQAHMLFGSSVATEELLTDSPLSFTELLSSSFAEQYLYHIMDERINGTGTGQYLGVLNAPCLVTVDKETSQDPATIVYENILEMRKRCWGYDNAVWLANRDTLRQLFLMNSTSLLGGVPIWYPAGFTGTGNADHPDTLLGRPIYFSEHPAVLGTTGDIILGDWSQYLEGTYQPMGSAESMHVRFFEHERAFKFFTRNDARPWWRTALTPKGSSPTLSPFVVIETRS
jgi:HK97 family phage major capsid protein